MSKELIKAKLQKELNETRARLEAWKAVTFVTKKDGKPYTRMQQNIKGARYALTSYALSAYNYELSVTGKINVQYIPDNILCSAPWDYIPADDPRRNKPQNVQPKESCLMQQYLYDLEDIKKAVADMINRRQKEIDVLEYQLENLDSIYDNFINPFYKLRHEMAVESRRPEHCDLYYLLIDELQHI